MNANANVETVNYINPATAMKRIHQDLAELQEDPLHGISLAMPQQSDPFTLLGNIEIMSGVYSGVRLHFELLLPLDFPLKGPKLRIVPGQDLHYFVHEHIYGNRQYGYKVCTDLLEDYQFYFKMVDKQQLRQNPDTPPKHKCGWTPAYSLSAILLQLQVFFADPDRPKCFLPGPIEIAAQIELLKKFSYEIKLDGNKKITHTYDNPYPTIPLSSSLINNDQHLQKRVLKQRLIQPQQLRGLNADELAHKESMLLKKQAMGRLTCFFTHMSPASNEHIVLGYPVMIQRDKFDRVHSSLFLEMLSFEGFAAQADAYRNSLIAQSNAGKKDSLDFDSFQLTTSMKETYNYWFPIYLNEETFCKFIKQIQTSLSILQYGFEGSNTKQQQFDPKLVLTVIPSLMNKMIVQLQDGKKHRSEAAIEAYCHFLRLLMRFLTEFPQLQILIDQKVDSLLQYNNNNNKDDIYERTNKKNLGDMGEFLILLGLSKQGLHNKQVWQVLVEEYLARQVFWTIDKIRKEESQNDDKENQKQNNNFNNQIKAKKQIKFFDITDIPLKRLYQYAQVSNNLLIFNYAAARHFLQNRDVFRQKIDDNYGVIPTLDCSDFIQDVNIMTQQIQTYPQLLRFIGLQDEFQDKAQVKALILYSMKLSVQQGYVKLDEYPFSQGMLILTRSLMLGTRGECKKLFSPFSALRKLPRMVTKLGDKFIEQVFKEGNPLIPNIKKETAKFFKEYQKGLYQYYMTCMNNPFLMEQLTKRQSQLEAGQLFSINRTREFRIEDLLIQALLYNLPSHNDKYHQSHFNINKTFLLEFLAREIAVLCEKDPQVQFLFDYSAFPGSLFFKMTGEKLFRSVLYPFLLHSSVLKEFNHAQPFKNNKVSHNQNNQIKHQRIDDAILAKQLQMNAHFPMIDVEALATSIIQIDSLKQQISFEEFAKHFPFQNDNNNNVNFQDVMSEAYRMAIKQGYLSGKTREFEYQVQEGGRKYTIWACEELANAVASKKENQIVEQNVHEQKIFEYNLEVLMLEQISLLMFEQTKSMFNSPLQTLIESIKIFAELRNLLLFNDKFRDQHANIIEGFEKTIENIKKDNRKLAQIKSFGAFIVQFHLYQLLNKENLQQDFLDYVLRIIMKEIASRQVKSILDAKFEQNSKQNISSFAMACAGDLNDMEISMDFFELMRRQNHLILTNFHACKMFILQETNISNESENFNNQNFIQQAQHFQESIDQIVKEQALDYRGMLRHIGMPEQLWGSYENVAQFIFEAISNSVKQDYTQKMLKNYKFSSKEEVFQLILS